MRPPPRAPATNTRAPGLQARARPSGAAPACGPLRGLIAPGAELQPQFLRHRIAACLPAWESCGASETVLSWLRDGYRLDFTGVPPPIRQGASFTRLDSEERTFLLSELQRLLNIGALEPATCTRYVTKAFLTPKPTLPGEPRKWRLIFDLRELNKCLRAKSCRYETLKTLRDLMEPNDWCVSIDVQDGFYAVPVHSDDRKYLTFLVDGVGYLQFAALPMGMSASPYVFTKVMRTFVQAVRSPEEMLRRFEESRPAAPPQPPPPPPPRAAAYTPPHRRHAAAPPPPPPPQRSAAAPTLRSLWRRHRRVMRRGGRVLPYVDDFLFLSRSRTEALELRDYVDALLELLGLQRNVKKGVREPTQSLTHLGLGVDSQRLLFYLPDKQRDKIITAAREILGRSAAEASLTGRRRLQGFCGLAQSVYLAVPTVRMHLRSLYDVLVSEPEWSARVRLTDQARRDLLWFVHLPLQRTTRPILRQPETAVVFTDASKSGWGGLAQTDGKEMIAKGFWRPEERLLHINVLEMRAKINVALSCNDLLRGRHIRFMGDNLVVTHVSNSLSSRSPVLMSETRALHDALDLLDATSVDYWLSTTENAAADRLSRDSDSGDWMLNGSAFSDLDRRWGPHTVDRFATEANKHLPRFNSAWAQPSTEGVDAFAQSNWRGETNWCNPPWALLPRARRPRCWRRTGRRSPGISACQKWRPRRSACQPRRTSSCRGTWATRCPWARRAGTR